MYVSAVGCVCFSLEDEEEDDDEEEDEEDEEEDDDDEEPDAVIADQRHLGSGSPGGTYLALRRSAYP
ncbi:unnamed protein product [Merluccius merluccius]